MLLANGASGIAVGMATEIPSHNLRELGSAAIAILKKPAISLDSILFHVPGPDFPGGGRIITSSSDLRTVYESGRGSVRVRAQWTVEQLARGHPIRPRSRLLICLKPRVRYCVCGRKCVVWKKSATS
jgi:topoisomerase-4 subunit A